MSAGEAQPRSLIASLLGDLDNARVVELDLLDGGSYNDGETPAVQMTPPPAAGD